MLSGMSAALNLSLPVVVALALAVGWVVAVLMSRWRGWAFAGSMVTASGAAMYLIVTLSPSASGPGFPGFHCVVQPLAGLLHPGAGAMFNLLILIPVGIGLALLGSSLLMTVSIAAVLALFVEVMQGMVPAIGRICDTQDAVANFAGALIGWLMVRFLQSVWTRASHERPVAKLEMSTES